MRSGYRWVSQAARPAPCWRLNPMRPQSTPAGARTLIPAEGGTAPHPTETSMKTTKTTLIATALLAALSITTAGAVAAQAPAAGADVAKHHGERHRGHGAPRGGDPIDAIARLDTDNDGRISRAEAQAGQQAWEARRQAHQAQRAERGDAQRSAGAGKRPQRDAGAPRPDKGRGFDLVANFDAIDSNRDGALSRGELRTWHVAKSAERRAEGERRFDAKFREADLNSDGKLSRVEVTEKMPRLAQRFAWMDENGDGFLSKEEVRPSRPQR
ncbi:hypothetical protein CNR27_07535 [Luteimonas chenhongjianii]|uniref:EF-hand domain-containing protein n=2 Tax=Luteimonas chenhongjianii TaxID=2006110 RepID=A0A290XDZ2_9GAMM|nr:hypothetical protein CNR27_07535 [Luteimonas chenhongjianii]